MSRALLRAAALAGITALACAAEPDAGATPADEAFVVSLVNSYRADPVHWDTLIGNGITGKALPGKLPPWQSATGHIAKVPAAGLAWDAKLAQAARASLARFSPAPEGSPHDPAPDLAANGLAGAPAALLLADGGANLRYVFAQSVLHCIKEAKGTKGSTFAFSRQQLVDPAFTACGTAVAKTASGYRLAIILGTAGPGRVVSGIGFRDANRNGILDPGEPLVPASVAVGAGTEPRAFPAGIWTAALPTAGPAVVTVSIDGHGWDFPVEAGARSAWIVRPMADKADIAEARRSLDALAKAKPGADVPDPAAFDLACRRPRLALDGATAAEVDKALAEVSPVIERARRELLDHLDDDKAATAKRLADIKRRWNGRGGTWIDFAKAYQQLNQAFGAWGRTEGDGRDKAARTLLAAIDQLAPKNADAVLWDQVAGWKAELELHLYGAERLAPPPSGKKPGGK